MPRRSTPTSALLDAGAAAARRAPRRGAAARRHRRQPRDAYEALKTYLMLYEPEHFDAEALKAWIGIDWDAN